jgi:hypothetical protein
MGAICTIHGTNVEAIFAHRLCKSSHHVKMTVELDLSGTVEEHEAVICKLTQFLQKPVYVIYQMLHTIHEATIGPPIFHLLHIVQTDQIPHVNITRVLKVFRCRVQVDHLDRASLQSGCLLDDMAKS